MAMRTSIAIVLLVACSKSEDAKKAKGDEQRWKTPRTATVSFGDYLGTIPAGWRDLRDDLDLDDLKGMPTTPAGTTTLTTELWAREADQPNIVVVASPADGLTPGQASCDGLAQAIAKASGYKPHDVAVADFQGNPGCKWAIEAAMNGRATTWVRGTQFHSVQCLWFPGHEKTDNEVCERFLAGVKPR
jgi:hypothetical protein